MKKRGFIVILFAFLLTTMLTLVACGAEVEISLNKTTLSLEAGRSETLEVLFAPENASNQNVTWESSNPLVVTVDGSGKVTAVAVGSATVTATAEVNGKAVSCEVTVIPVAAREISLDKEILGMQVGNEESLTVFFSPVNTTNKSVTWSVQPAGVVTVATDGKITAVAIGSATVTATSADGNKTASCEVVVIGKTISSAEDFAAINLKLDGEFYLTQDIDFANAKVVPIGTWSDIGAGATDKRFTGTFDGKGFALLNLEMDGNAIKLESGNVWGNALFCQIGEGGVVKNLNIVGMKSHGDGACAAIAGINAGLIENCYVEANLYSYSAWDAWPWACGGAIAGYNQPSGVIKNIIVNCNTDKTYTFVGNNYGLVENCFAVVDEVSLTDPLTEFASIMTGNVPTDMEYTPGEFSQCQAFGIYDLETIDFSVLTGTSAWVAGATSDKGPYLATDANTVREWLVSAVPIEGTVEISTLEQLLAIKNNVATLSADYVLKNDIDATSINWTSLGTFLGTFDGQGHTVKIASTTGTGNLGFFLKIMPGAVVENLKLIGTAKFASWAGGICQDNFGTIRNCLVNLDMTADGSDGYLGGIACNNKAFGVIEYCIVLSEIKGFGTVAQLEWNGKAAPNGGIVTGQENGAEYNECYFNVETASGDSMTDSAKGKPLVTYAVGSDVYSETDSYPEFRKTTAELQSAELYDGWDTDIWDIAEGRYPALKTA